VRNKRFDVSVSPLVYKACVKLRQLLLKRGCPVKGSWSFDINKPWVVYTDASGIAKGAVLEIGGVIVEDATTLRGTKDKRHSNDAEFEALELGLKLAAKYKTVLLPGKKENLRLEVRCDNQSVVTWMNKAASGIDSPIGGTHCVQNTKTLERLMKLAGDERLALTVLHVTGNANKADALTRTPDCFREAIDELLEDECINDFTMGLEIENSNDVAVTVADGSYFDTMDCAMAQKPVREKTEDGLTIPLDDSDARTFLRLLHHASGHLGGDYLYFLASKIVSYKALSELCRVTSSTCEACLYAKGGIFLRMGDQFSV
jgi:hypothetical protein